MSQYGPITINVGLSIAQRLALLDWTYLEGAHQPGGGWGNFGTIVSTEAWKNVEPQVREYLLKVTEITETFVTENRVDLLESGAI